MSLEYATLGQFNTKENVYNFIILLLESISNRKAILQSARNNMYHFIILCFILSNNNNKKLRTILTSTFNHVMKTYIRF